jgi:hypothetical protein
MASPPAAREAAGIAKANRIPGAAPVVLAAAPAFPNATWKSAFQVDPFTIPIEQKAQLLIDANTEALKVANVKFVNSTLIFNKEDRNYANTDGSFITQTVIRSWAPFTATGGVARLVGLPVPSQHAAACWARVGIHSSPPTSSAMRGSGEKRPRENSRPSRRRRPLRSRAAPVALVAHDSRVHRSSH